MRKQVASWSPSILRSPSRISKNRFRFLNEEHEIGTWNDENIAKLWLYNLHYFEFPEAEIIEQWIRENPIGIGNGWEPYPLALRIVNWIKWALGGAPISPEATESLQIQAEYLLQAIEYHLGANHLFADATALTMAGMFFEGDFANRWLETGTRLLRRELEEQVLADGGHYERSPMYHAIILENILDLNNAARVYVPLAGQNTCLWSLKAKQMLAWLSNMVHSDGQIAFFNDATLGIAPEPSKLSAYANSLNLRSLDLPLGASGYVRLENSRSVLIFDAGHVGPDYQPGHAHSDTLSFELSCDSIRTIVNTGISTYEKNPLRQSQRSTEAHNTIRVDGIDQSEVWSGFRVGRRARPFDVRTDGMSFVEAAHDGYRRLSNPVIHRRRIELKDYEVIITDRLEGRGHHKADVFFHFHPNSRARITLDHKLIKDVKASFWHPAFNTSIRNTTIIGSWAGECPVQFTTVIPLQT